MNSQKLTNHPFLGIYEWVIWQFVLNCMSEAVFQQPRSLKPITPLMVTKKDQSRNQKENHTELQSQAKQALSVSTLNEIVRSLVQNHSQLHSIWLEGEVSNLTKHSSGHIYFSLKDENSQIRCTFFKPANAKYQHLLVKDGPNILIFGDVTVYSKRGEYQFNVKRLMLVGQGEIRLRIEALKKKLRQEGLFDRQHKKPLPYLPHTLGIATAATGAALRDIMHIALRRYPNINILLAPCQVQGDQAPASIIKALGLLQQPQWQVDVIIIGRGGGSFEDLQAFNDEDLVRTIVDCNIPIISAVGHEIDSSLSDFAADTYAATPTAAAEMAVPDAQALLDFIEESHTRIRVYLEAIHRESAQKLAKLLNAPVYQEPLCIFQGHYQHLDSLKKNLQQSIRMTYERALRLYERLSHFPILYTKHLNNHKKKYELLGERLQNYSPLGTLNRGYAIVRNHKKQVISQAQATSLGEEVEVLLKQGKLIAEIKKVMTDAKNA